MTAARSFHTRFQVHYRSLRREHTGFAFPCDEQGRVEIDALTERVRNDYLYARAMVGRETAPPALVRAST